MWVVCILCALVAIATTYGVTLIREQTRDCRQLGKAVDFPRDSVAYEPCVPAYVVRGLDGAVTVFLAESPHMRGEPLTWSDARGVFYSPEHGETYDLQGDPLPVDIQGSRISIGGTRGLWRCPIRIVQGEIVIQSDSRSGSELRMSCKR